MVLSIYEASIPQFVRMLRAFSAILDKARVHAQEHGVEEAILIDARLAPDMFPLARQVQIATDGVKACAARMAGIDTPSYPDTETSFAELQERVGKTIAFLESVPAAAVEGAADRRIVFKLQGREMEFSGASYLFSFVLPNFYFHLTTAYTILRHNGVAIGKRDFLGGI